MPFYELVVESPGCCMRLSLSGGSGLASFGGALHKALHRRQTSNEMAWLYHLGVSFLWTGSVSNTVVGPVVTFLKQAEGVPAVGFYGWMEKGYILPFVLFTPLTEFTIAWFTPAALKGRFLLRSVGEALQGSFCCPLAFPSMTDGRMLGEKNLDFPHWVEP